MQDDRKNRSIKENFVSLTLCLTILTACKSGEELVKKGAPGVLSGVPEHSDCKSDSGTAVVSGFKSNIGMRAECVSFHNNPKTAMFEIKQVEPRIVFRLYIDKSFPTDTTFDSSNGVEYSDEHGGEPVLTGFNDLRARPDLRLNIDEPTDGGSKVNTSLIWHYFESGNGDDLYVLTGSLITNLNDDRKGYSYEFDVQFKQVKGKRIYKFSGAIRSVKEN